MNRDNRYLILASVILAAYVFILTVPTLRHFFELYPLKLIHNLGIGLVALLWVLAVRFAWRNALLDRFMGTRISPF
ncbi:hypothetical protein IQ250_01465 [Pseudanabaenaceae cyanobacterium LEGE 13415]|nr:hypothetical protein [Pseudanabaenaceae cyanobacterium LEGE 13415]